MQDIDSNRIASLCAMISGASRISLVTHAHPDGDAIGSCMGLFHFLTDMGKSPVVVLNDRYPESIAFMVDARESSSILVFEEDSMAATDAISASDLIFCLDFNSFGRTEKLEKALAESGAAKILIDHHLNPDTGLFSLVFSEIAISSTSELLYHILMATPAIGMDAKRLNPRTGRALMTGMTTDTNNFSNSVFPSTFTMASSLLAAGVDRDGIIMDIYNNYRENRIRLQGHLLKDNMKITAEGVAIIIIDRKTAAHYDMKEGESEGFVNIPLAIRDVKMSILAKEDTDRFRISIRSKRGISANRCATLYFNGGGHEQAAGGKLMFGTDIANDITRLSDYIEKVSGIFMSGERDR